MKVKISKVVIDNVTYYRGYKKFFFGISQQQDYTDTKKM